MSFCFLRVLKTLPVSLQNHDEEQVNQCVLPEINLDFLIPNLFIYIKYTIYVTLYYICTLFNNS
jgi:hypothetical protein